VNKHTIWIIISLMSIALVGLISFQLYWINNALKLSQDRFEKDVFESLHVVADKLERNEMMMVASQSFSYQNSTADDDAQTTVDIHVDSNTPNPIIREEYIEGAEGKRVTFKSNDGNYQVIYIDDSVDQEVDWTFEVDSAARQTVVAELEKVNKPNDVAATRVIKKTARFNTVIREMISHENHDIKRIHPKVLDSMLMAEFSNKGIHIKFEFGVFDDQQNEFVMVRGKSPDKLRSTPLKANLFPNDIIGNSNYLMVNFPEQSKYLFQKVWSTLASSLLFLAIIISSFAYAIYIINKQRKLSELKTDFINNMTHEFKTPIATVALACEAISEDAVQSDRGTMLRYIGVIKDENKRLGTQVEKVLQIASMDKDDFELNKQPVDLHELIQNAADRAAIPLENRNGNITLSLDATTSMCTADQLHISNVIFNLLDNAIKYSKDRPQIDITTKNKGPELILTVKDNGIGMSKDTVKFIFDKFYRVPTGDVHDVKGFGLGLSYARFVVEGHGGQISVKSEQGIGSAFTLSLPLQHG
jgi:two-component system phosphate regulon sensor histidine kinase PhoR